MSSTKPSTSETILIDLVHDLRQHLGIIETSVYCMGLLNEGPQPRTQEYLRTIEQQVARADRRLSEAGAELNRVRAQRAEGEEILALTKSVTSAVT